MNDDTLRMAREAGLPTAWISESGIVQWAQLGRLIALARADERERLYGKDIDTFLFEEHQLAFEKGRRSEREACAKVCDDHATKDGFEGCYANACAESIRARGNT
jgi:hypothetical protein